MTNYNETSIPNRETVVETLYNPILKLSQDLSSTFFYLKLHLKDKSGNKE